MLYHLRDSKEKSKIVFSFEILIVNCELWIAWNSMKFVFEWWLNTEYLRCWPFIFLLILISRDKKITKRSAILRFVRLPHLIASRKLLSYKENYIVNMLSLFHYPTITVSHKFHILTLFWNTYCSISIIFSILCLSYHYY
jgi:hypothetical protein